MGTDFWQNLINKRTLKVHVRDVSFLVYQVDCLNNSSMGQQKSNATSRRFLQLVSNLSNVIMLVVVRTQVLCNEVRTMLRICQKTLNFARRSKAQDKSNSV